MGQRVGTLVLLATLLAAGALLGSALSQWWEEAPPLETPDPAPRIQGRVTVEVLNGAGRSGMAREATGALRDLGFDVVYYGNAETFTNDPSVVLDRVGRSEAARWTAQALGIREIRSAPDSSRYVDVTVRLGPEWALDAGRTREEDAPRPWWDVRRFFPGDGPAEEPDSTRR